MSAIRLTNVTTRFGDVLAVDKLSLSVEEHDFVTLLGPSGCGKTTTLRMIAGLETPTEGRIELDGVVVFDSEKKINVPANRRGVGLLFQSYALWPNMTIYENIAYPLSGKIPPEEVDTTVRAMAETLKIESFLDRYPAQLSGGQRQRAAIARTLAPRPRVILMDEPLSNLDAKLRLEMRSELQRLHLATGCAFLYVTHDQLEAMTLSTRVCLMDHGVLRQDAPPLTVYRRPADLFAADFVGSPPINLLEAVCAGAEGGLDLALTGGGTARFSFRDRTETALPEDGEVTLGVRPEMILPGETGLPGTIYSVLPAGMETTVRIQTEEAILTAVIFGAAPFAIGDKTRVSFAGEDVLLFRRDSGKLLGAGSLAWNAPAEDG